MNLINKETWELFTPNRIGDCLMSLPATICLSLLVPDSIQLRLMNNSNITPLLGYLDILPSTFYQNIIKIKSWFKPKAKAIFYNTQSQHQFHRAKQTLGWPNKGKKLSQWLNRYNTNLPGIRPVEGKQKPYHKFAMQLEKQFGFSSDIIHYFSIPLALGYSENEILAVLPKAMNLIKTKATQTHYTHFATAYENYFTVCIEAAYGATRAENRRWEEANFFKVISEIKKKYKLTPIFIGLEDSKLPEDLKNNCEDLRLSLSLIETAELQKNATFHLGNDSGLAHLANLMQTPTYTIYLATQSKQYGPIYPHLNHPIQSPKSAENVLSEIESTLFLEKLSLKT